MVAMRDDIVPPATTQEQRDAAELIRLRRLRDVLRRCNELAASMGYEGAEAALLSLQAMKRGPRKLSESEKDAQT